MPTSVFPSNSSMEIFNTGGCGCGRSVGSCLRQSLVARCFGVQRERG